VLAPSLLTAMLWADGGRSTASPHRQRERGSRTPKQDYRTRESKVL